MKITELMIDPEKATNGVWEKIGGGAEILIARWDRNCDAELVAAIAAESATGDDERSRRRRREITADKFSRKAFLGVRGLEDEDGTLVQGETPEQRTALLLKAEVLYDIVDRLSVRNARFRPDVSGNSLNGSTGN